MADGPQLRRHHGRQDGADGPEADAQREVLERNYDIATQVMDLRLQHGLTQAELAELCGMGQPDISRIERGSTSQPRSPSRRLQPALDAEVRLVPKAS